MAQNRTCTVTCLLLLLLLVCPPSAALLSRHARPPSPTLPHPSLAPVHSSYSGHPLLPLPPKPCQTDDLLGGLEQLAGPDAQGNRSAWQLWLQQLKVWRTQVHEAMSYSDSHYAHRNWTQRNLVSPQMHAFDAGFYTVGKGYTPEAWLDGLLQRYGGIDSLLLWVTCAAPPSPQPPPPPAPAPAAAACAAQ